MTVVVCASETVPCMDRRTKDKDTAQFSLLLNLKHHDNKSQLFEIPAANRLVNNFGAGCAFSAIASTSSSTGPNANSDCFSSSCLQSAASMLHRAAR